MLKYRRKDAQWDVTDNPCIAQHWIATGSAVEVLEDGAIVTVYVPNDSIVNE